MVHPGREASFWADVTADMMSDEEKVEDKYIRHPPDYRSEKFSKFLDKLDHRATSKCKHHARFKRDLGSPRIKSPPANAKPWMLKEEAAIEHNTSGNDSETPSEVY